MLRRSYNTMYGYTYYFLLFTLFFFLCFTFFTAYMREFHEKMCCVPGVYIGILLC